MLKDEKGQRRAGRAEWNLGQAGQERERYRVPLGW